MKNELILAMIEKNSEWERILTENIIQCDEEVWNSLQQYVLHLAQPLKLAYFVVSFFGYE